MPLTCYCGDEDYDWWQEPPKDYQILNTKRARRCASCGEKIKVGDLCARWDRWRHPHDDVEERIYGGWEGEVPLAHHWHCERCADLYFSFEDLGFQCISSNEDMRELATEYAETYGPAAVKRAKQIGTYRMSADDANTICRKAYIEFRLEPGDRVDTEVKADVEFYLDRESI